MKRKFLLPSILIIILASCDQEKNKLEVPVVKRVGMVIKLKEKHLDEYKALHADSEPGVRELLNKYHLQNFSIFLTQLEDGHFYEFGYYEYTGEDFESDMKALAEEPRNIDWLKICDPMQEPIGDNEGWKEMDQIYFNP